jgi:gamma-glutamylputrescine oxidase
MPEVTATSPHLAAPLPPSPWLADVSPLEVAPPLAGERRVDVAVVGAGYTGLGAALALREEGLSVAVIERDFAGFGASGRNAGHVTPTIGKDLPTLLRVYGPERARRYVSLVETAIAYVEALIERHGIDCDYHPAGNVIAAVHPRQHPRLERAADAAAALGLRAEWLSPEAMRKRGLPASFTAGVLEPLGGTLHPGRYVRGLRRAALASGAELYERTPLVAIEEGPRPLVRTPDGALRADRVVLATNAYAPETGYLRWTALPLWVSAFRTAPLTPAQREALDWPRREGIYTAHEILESYHLCADGRIVGSSKTVRYGYAGHPLPERHPPSFARLERAFRERFPGLAVRIEDFWSGPTSFALDFLPAIGSTGRYRNLLHAIAYAGHGIPLASYAGRILADWIVGRDGPGRVLVGRRSVPLPPEPLRWLVVQSLLGLLGRMDARLDARVRRARP